MRHDDVRRSQLVLHRRARFLRHQAAAYEAARHHQGPKQSRSHDLISTGSRTSITTKNVAKLRRAATGGKSSTFAATSAYATSPANRTIIPTAIRAVRCR